jgi:hypothetical protein
MSALGACASHDGLSTVIHLHVVDDHRLRSAQMNSPKVRARFWQTSISRAAAQERRRDADGRLEREQRARLAMHARIYKQIYALCRDGPARAMFTCGSDGDRWLFR